MSIHPSRQAYVEEEVSSAPSRNRPNVSRRYSHALPERASPTAQPQQQHAKGPLTDSTTQETTLDLASLPTDTNYQIRDPNTGQSQHASTVLGEFARKRRANALAVPTDDARVRQELRARGEPITLFGERKEDRRDRLRELLLGEQDEGAADEDESMADADEDGDGDEEGEFYIEGSEALSAARRDIAKYSLPRAAKRLAHQKIESKILVQSHVKHRKGIKEKLGSVELFGSQIASERPVSIVRFAPNNEVVASGDWAGSVRLLDVPNLETKKVLRGHKGMIGGISWLPGATLPNSTISSDSLNLATSAADNEIHLWSLSQDTPIATLSGHSARICRTEFHPSGKYLASASYDTTWRLWDVATTTELLLQEGHSKEVYSVGFNEDGSLIASAGLDSIGRIWDMRTGRTAMILEGHVGPIHALDWSCDGYRVITGSADGFAKCWDMRAVRETASIGAHVGGVSDLRWYKGTDGPLSGHHSQNDTIMTNGGGQDDTVDQQIRPKKAGTFLVSSGFDKTVNIFSADDWALCKSLTGHDGTVLSVDVTSDARFIASCGRDRTVKLWARDDMGGI